MADIRSFFSKMKPKKEADPAPPQPEKVVKLPEPAKSEKSERAPPPPPVSSPAKGGKASKKEHNESSEAKPAAAAAAKPTAEDKTSRKSKKHKQSEDVDSDDEPVAPPKRKSKPIVLSDDEDGDFAAPKPVKKDSSRSAKGEAAAEAKAGPAPAAKKKESRSKPPAEPAPPPRPASPLAPVAAPPEPKPAVAVSTSKSVPKAEESKKPAAAPAKTITPSAFFSQPVAPAAPRKLEDDDELAMAMAILESSESDGEADRDEPNKPSTPPVARAVAPAHASVDQASPARQAAKTARLVLDVDSMDADIEPIPAVPATSSPAKAHKRTASPKASPAKREKSEPATTPPKAPATNNAVPAPPQPPPPTTTPPRPAAAATAASQPAKPTGAPSEGALRAKASYLAHLRRGGPQHLGQKEIPTGEPMCLENLRFIVTGVLDSIEREDAENLIKRYGGIVAKTVGKKLDYAVVGSEPGPKKMEQIHEFKIPILDEDGLFDLVRTRPGKRAAPAPQSAAAKPAPVVRSLDDENDDMEDVEPPKARPPALFSTGSIGSSAGHPDAASAAAQPKAPPPPADNSGLLWAEKYRPTTLDQLIGQHGPKSAANKLVEWLKTWHSNRRRTDKAPDKASETGWEKKAALMHGGPGLGKTSTALIACQLAGYEVVELNASDTRSKRSLQEHVADLVGNTTLTQFWRKDNPQNKPKQALIMDEVDGMAGNEDRGGVAELIDLIKKSQMPIICIANDLPQKLKSLRNYCFELPFRKPLTKQIAGKMMSVAFKEGLKIDMPTLEAIVEGAGGDIRQVLNNMFMWSRESRTIDWGKGQAIKSTTQKDAQQTPWEFVPRFFQSGHTIDHLLDGYFYDYSMAPMFVQENYLGAIGGPDPRDTLARMSAAADAICDGDLMDRAMYESMQFSTLPLMGVLSCIRPAFLTRGRVGQIQFSTWFGNNSRQGKMSRLVAELQLHTRMTVSSDVRGMRLAYLPALRTRISAALADADGPSAAVAVLDAYDLSREDWDSIHEVCQLKGMHDPMAAIDSKSKAAFTRFYNKGSHTHAYAEHAVAKKSRGAAAAAAVMDGEGEEELVEDEEQQEESVGTDAMIKAKAASAKASGAKAADKPAKARTNSKGKK